MGYVDRTISESGLVTDIGFEDGKMLIRYQQNTAPAHELNLKLRNDPEVTKTGIKNDFWKVCHLTEADCMKMIVEDGVNPYTMPAKELKQYLARNKDKWGHLFTTSGRF